MPTWLQILIAFTAPMTAAVATMGVAGIFRLVKTNAEMSAHMDSIDKRLEDQARATAQQSAANAAEHRDLARDIQRQSERLDRHAEREESLFAAVIERKAV